MPRRCGEVQEPVRCEPHGAIPILCWPQGLGDKDRRRDREHPPGRLDHPRASRTELRGRGRILPRRIRRREEEHRGTEESSCQHSALGA